MLEELSKLWVGEGDLLLNESIVAILSAMVTSLKHESVHFLGQLVLLIIQVLTVDVGTFIIHSN
jgi:hypothetical protein